jgi:hypothetical protein
MRFCLVFESHRTARVRRTAPYRFHRQSHALLDVPAATAFAYLDDFRRLSAHMERASIMMVGSNMKIETDAAGGSRDRVQGPHARQSRRSVR